MNIMEEIFERGSCIIELSVNALQIHWLVTQT